MTLPLAFFSRLRVLARTLVWRMVRLCVKQQKRQALDQQHYSACARRKVACAGPGLKVNAPCRFTRNCRFGRNCNFNGMIVRGCGTLTIGDNFHSGEGCRIITSNHNFNGGDAIPYDATHVAKHVVIEDNVWLGDCVLVVGNVTIGEGAICGAGAVVCRDVPAGAIVGGNPAHVIGYRDMEHYAALRRAGRFH